MRTKTLLIAAAAMAVSVATSMAQTTYSQNVVGYANLPTPVSGNNYLLTVPFVMGASNGINEVFSTPLPDGSSVLLWSVGGQSYTTYIADTGSPSGWDDAGFNPLSSLPTIPVGQGFFLNPAGPITNTFAGTIAVNVGTSNNMVLSVSGNNYLVGCVVPYAGPVNSGNSSTGGPNLNSFPDGSSMLIWSVAGQSYTTFIADTGSPSGWDDAGFNPTGVPSITVGQGFFLNPASPYTWTTGL